MYMAFEWDANNESKPIRHGLSLAEVEEALTDPNALAFPPRFEAHEVRLPARRRVERAYQERNPRDDD